MSIWNSIHDVEDLNGHSVDVAYARAHTATPGPAVRICSLHVPRGDDFELSTAAARELAVMLLDAANRADG